MQAKLTVFCFLCASYILACGSQQQTITSVDESATTSAGGDALVISFITKETPRSGGFETEVHLKLMGAQEGEFALASLSTQCSASVVRAPHRMMLKCYWAGHGDEFVVEKEGLSLVVSHMVYRDGMETEAMKRRRTIALTKDYRIEFSTKMD